MEAPTRDKALFLLAGNNPFSPDSPEARRVLRKIDSRIIPMLLTVYTFMLVDKNSLSFASIMGIQQAAHLTPLQYSWTGSIVYFGYLAGELPVAYLMQRLPLAKFFSFMVMAWGGILVFHSACHNFGGLMAVRFLLGFVEVCTAPIIIYILGSWYTKEEQISRVAIWYTSFGWGNILSGFLSWCILHASSFRWQALFILEGSLTIALGIFLWFFLAASPTDAEWLSDEEKIIALERVRDDKRGTELWRFNKVQLREAMNDHRLYLIFLLLVSTGLPNGGLTVFGPSIISAFGFTVEQTTLLSMAPGLASIIGTLFAMLIAKQTNRTIAGMCTIAISCVGVLMMFTIPPENRVARYGGYILTMQFPISIVFVITFITAGVAGSTKKLAFGASYQLGFTIGSIIGPQTYQESDQPNYYVAKYTMLGFLLLSFFLIATVGSLHAFWNRKRDDQDRIDTQNGVRRQFVRNQEFLDLTDFQLQCFRYPV
ncbi:permease of the major facilitator superfamily [Thozetella sp. PMI_491]|nr:permease of the major facilitator superfamily [Thozetella sp. PMI_491]